MASADRDREDGDEAVPGYRNYLVYSDESGLHGATYNGFGTLWMPHERRGDFAALVAELRRTHAYRNEAKWTKVKRESAGHDRVTVHDIDLADGRVEIRLGAGREAPPSDISLIPDEFRGAMWTMRPFARLTPASVCRAADNIAPTIRSPDVDWRFLDRGDRARAFRPILSNPGGLRDRSSGLSLRSSKVSLRSSAVKGRGFA